MSGIEKRRPVLTELPFVGRSSELDQIAEFSKQASNAKGLSILWITGEAGIGKSSLLRHATELIQESESTPLHVCLFPSSTESIVQLLADAINADPQVSSLLASSVSRTLPSVLEALHRLTRLRQIVLVLEDLHLLTEQSGQEFETFMESLGQTSLGVICASRPDPAISNAYRLLLPFLVDTIELSPLSFADVKHLLQELEISSREVNLTGYVHRATRGNPFIIRAVVSELHLVSFGSVQENPSFASLLINEKAVIAIENFVRSLLGTLSPEERDAIQSLTLLGELFSFEAASRLFGNTEAVLTRLSELGLIAKSLRASMPLIGETESAFPYVFAHSLLYEKLEELAVYSESQIESLFDSGAAIYSTVPFEKLAHLDPSGRDGESIVRVVHLLSDSFSYLGWLTVSSIDSALFIVKQIEEFTLKRKPFLSPEQLEEVETELLSIHSYVTAHLWADEERAVELEKYVAISSHPKTVRRAMHYCNALFARMADLVPSSSDLEVDFNRIKELGQQFPEITTTVQFIKIIGQILGRTTTQEGFANIRSYYLSVLDRVTDPSMTHIVHHARLRLLHKWFELIETPSELGEYIALRNAIEESALDDVYDARSDHFYPILYSYGLTGRAVEAHGIVRGEVDRLLGTSSAYLNQLLAKRLLLRIKIQLGVSLADIERELGKVLGAEYGEYSYSDPHKPTPKIFSALALDFVSEGMRRGNVHWGEKIATSIVPTSSEYYLDETRLLSALFRNDESALQRLSERVLDVDDFYVQVLQSALTEPKEWPEELKNRFKGLLQSDIVAPRLLLRVQVLLHLLGYHDPEGSEDASDDEYREAATGAVCRAIDWCLENDLVGWSEPFAHYAKALLSPEALASTLERMERTRSDVLSRISDVDPSRSGTHQTTLTMIGSISIAEAGEEAKKVRGSRVRHVLGMMVANQTMRVPLELGEFGALATGMDLNDTAVRTRNYLHTILSRIRDLIGRDAIVTDGKSAPSLNLEIVAVDILKVLQLTHECESFVRRSIPRRATQLAREIIDLVGSGGPYPTLDDDFFQAARDDFEIVVRQTLLSVARLLQQEGDLEEADELLRTMSERLPHDDEVLQARVGVLKTMGHNAEALLLSSQVEGSE